MKRRRPRRPPHFRRLFEHAAIGIAEVDCSGRIVCCNEAFCRITGYPRAWLKFRTFQDITHPDDLEADVEKVNEVLSGKISRYNLEKRYIRADGSIVWVRLTVSGVAGAGGKIEHFVSCIEDLSERKLAEAAYRESEERFAAFMAHSPLAAWVADRSGTLRYVSPAYVRLLNVGSQPLVGRRLDEVYPERVARDYLDNNEKVLATLETLETRETGLTRDGREETFLVLKFPVWSRDGELMVGGLALDLTKQVENEVALRLALDAAEATNRAKSFFLANMSHEIRTPLNAILGFSELLKLRELSPEQREDYLEVLMKNGWHLNSLLEDLLDIARIEAEKTDVQRVVVDLRSLIEDTMRMMAPAADGAGVSLMSFISPAVPKELHSDPTRLKQILTNVIGNAIKFTGRQGNVKVQVERQGESRFLEIRVTDTGPGVPLEHQERIFDAFHQVDTTLRRRSGGMGLGLTLGRKLARLLGGELALVQSAPGQGSTFLLTVALEEA